MNIAEKLSTWMGSGSSSTLKAIEKKGQVGRKGNYFHLGSVGKSKISLIDPQSVLVLGSPGSGKTSRLVIPSILASDTCSMLVHDLQGELWSKTSGHRSSLGPTYRIDWSTMDSDDGISSNRFNFLDPRIVPPAGSHRDVFLDSVAKILIPKTTSGNAYFADRGRLALTGFLQMFVARIQDRTDDERYAGISERFVGQDASLPMLTDWLVNSQIISSGTMLKDLLEEAEKWDYPLRAISELSALSICADREYAGILGAMEQGLLPFKNSAVVERCSSSDFIPEDLRGRLTDESVKSLGLDHYPSSREDWDKVRENPSLQDWKPVSVYLVGNPAVGNAFHSLTVLFLETCSRTLLSWGPDETTESGVQMGPSPTCFAMDDFEVLPRIPSFLEGPDLGRSKKVGYLLTAQGYSPMSRSYSREDQALIDGTTVVKIILRQNNEESSDRISRMTGSLARSDVSDISQDKQIMLVSGSMDKPLRMDNAPYSEIPEVSAKAEVPPVG